MPPLSEQEARAILEKALKLSKAESCEANLSVSAGGNIRFARSTVTTAGAASDRALVVQSNFGQRSGTATINQLDDASIERVVRRSEELARLAPADPEFMPPLPQQQYVETKAFFDSTAAISPEYRAQAAAQSLAAARDRDCSTAGFLQDGASWSAMMNSAGLLDRKSVV